jgi:hypothetical protein
VLEISNRDLSVVGVGISSQASFQNSSISRVSLQTTSSINSQSSAAVQTAPQQLQQQQSTGSASTSATTSEDDSTPILLQVLSNSFSENVPVDSIRIDQAASNTPFSIKPLSYVYVTVVDSSKVSLDLVELLFKESYLNGNDMLRIKKHLVRLVLIHFFVVVVAYNYQSFRID